MSSFNYIRRASIGTMLLLALAGMGHAESWQGLFNGRDFAGWRQVSGTATYQVRNGVIIGTTVVGSPNSFLATEKAYGDFILEMEIKQEDGRSNGGVQFRSESRLDYQNGRVHGYQFDIDPSERAWTGGIYDEGRRGWLYPVDLNPSAKNLYRFGDWNRIRIEAIGPVIRTWVNEAPVAHLVDDRTSVGFIALQVHGIGRHSENSGRATLWRHLRIQTINLRPSPPDDIFIRNLIPNSLTDAELAQGWRLLWDGTGRGWRQGSGERLPSSRWHLDNGELVAAASSVATAETDYLATDELFGAFELQIEFLLTAGADSGIHYRSYEYQLVDEMGKPSDAQGKRSLGALVDIAARGSMPGGQGIGPRLGQWQHARVIAREDGSVEHWLNGIRIVSYQPTGEQLTPPTRIRFSASDKEVRFRSIKLRHL